MVKGKDKDPLEWDKDNVLDSFGDRINLLEKKVGLLSAAERSTADIDEMEGALADVERQMSSIESVFDRRIKGLELIMAGFRERVTKIEAGAGSPVLDKAWMDAFTAARTVRPEDTFFRIFSAFLQYIQWQDERRALVWDKVMTNAELIIGPIMAVATVGMLRTAGAEIPTDRINEMLNRVFGERREETPASAESGEEARKEAA